MLHLSNVNHSELEELKMAIDLTKLSLKELDQLIGDAQAQRERALSQAKRDAYEAAKRAAEEFGLSINDILPTRAAYTPSSSGSSERKPRKQPEFHYEANGNRWTGAGRAPAWMPADKAEWAKYRVPNPNYVAE